MLKKCFLSLGVVLLVLSDSGVRVSAQEGEPHIRVVVDLVQLNVAVTDKKGNYITGLRPQDFAIVEDGIPQKLATFAEGNESARRVLDLTGDSKPTDQPAAPPRDAASPASDSSLGALVAGANVFILFDTSNYMYRGFVFAQDAISDFGVLFQSLYGGRMNRHVTRFPKLRLPDEKDSEIEIDIRWSRRRASLTRIPVTTSRPKRVE